MTSATMRLRASDHIKRVRERFMQTGVKPNIDVMALWFRPRRRRTPLVISFPSDPHQTDDQQRPLHYTIINSVKYHARIDA